MKCLGNVARGSLVEVRLQVFTAIVCTQNLGLMSLVVTFVAFKLQKISVSFNVYVCYEAVKVLFSFKLI